MGVYWNKFKRLFWPWPKTLAVRTYSKARESLHDTFLGPGGITWSSLRLVGNSAIFKSSFIWIIGVPVAAKILAPVAGQYEWTGLQVHRVIDDSSQKKENGPPPSCPACRPPAKGGARFTLGLPFNWYTFYAMAWMFFLGELVYLTSCPRFIRRFGSFREFRRSSAGINELTDASLYVAISLPPGVRYRFLACLRTLFPWRSPTLDDEMSKLKADPTQQAAVHAHVEWAFLLMEGRDKEPVVSDAFAETTSFANKLAGLRRWLCLVCFGLGFLLLAVVMYQNADAVYDVAVAQQVKPWDLIVGH